MVTIVFCNVYQLDVVDEVWLSSPFVIAANGDNKEERIAGGLWMGGQRLQKD